MKKILATIFLAITSILYLFDITLFSTNNLVQMIIGLLILLSLVIVFKKK